VLSHSASAFNVAGTGFGLEAMTTLPLFHNHGHACFYRAIHSGKKLSLFPTEIPLTTGNIIAAIENAPGVQGFYVVPYVLKLLAESVVGIELLKGFELVTYGGAACPDELGDRLVKENDVKLVEHYGLTEV
jgi:acyl-CoA synthetase (AMP-forming)/AMP-acid ligase II